MKEKEKEGKIGVGWFNNCWMKEINGRGELNVFAALSYVIL